MRRHTRLLAFTALLLPSLLSGQVVRNGALPTLFPRTNWWNTDISRAPVDPNSATYISFVGTGVGLHPDFGGDADGTEIYGMPWVVVPGTQALVPMTFGYDDQSDYGAPGRAAGYPLPPIAITEGKWIEGGYPAADPNAYGDRHMLVVDRDNQLLFETWATEYDSVLNRWYAGSGAVFRLNSNERRPDEWTSADAAGLAILPGLLRYDEVFAGTPIRHAFRVTVRATNGYVFPASHVAGQTNGALPMGARLRLKASKNISTYPAEIQRIFEAMKTYGLIVADNGTDMYVSGSYDTRWNNDVLNPAFSSLKASDFEVIRLGWRPSIDFNSDGKNDIVWRNASTGANAVWTMNGTAFGAINDLPALPNNNYVFAAQGDFNRDGKSDIVLRNQSSGANAVWLLNGTQLSGIVDLPALANTAYQFCGAADFDGDDQPDLILRNTSTGQNALWLMNGTALKQIVDLPALPNTNYVIAGAGDFDYDGETDIVLRNRVTGQNALWLLRGTTLLAIRDLPALPNTSFVIGGIGDVDGDYSPDVIWRNTTTGQNAAWLMSGASLRQIVDLPALPTTTWVMSGPR